VCSSDLTPPAVPTVFVTVSTFKSIILTWTNPTDLDFDYINIYRGLTSTRGSASLIAQISGTFYVDNIGTYGQTRYYWISAVDSSGNVSSEAGPAYATTAMVATSDIDTFAILASQIYTKIPIVTGDAWTDNSPGAGSVAWNSHTLVFNGITYSISSGNTNLKYIYWLGPLFGSANVSVTTTPTSLTDTRLSMAVDKYVGIIINCNGRTLTVTSNTANTFTGLLAWSPVGAPGNGYEWSTNNCLSPFSGTANAAVTTTTTTLTDTRLTMRVNEYVGIIITCNSKTMTVVNNTITTFIGASWSGGGTPGNGFAWSSNERVTLFSGTANVAVSTTAISLTDTRLSMIVNKYAGEIITCNDKTMVIVSNTATAFTGASWSDGGTPGNGFAWSLKPVTFYFKSAIHPGNTLGDSDFIIAVNLTGIHDLAWNAVANQVIGSAYIQDGAIQNAKIENLAVDTAKIADLSVNTLKIAGNAVTIPYFQMTPGRIYGNGAFQQVAGPITVANTFTSPIPVSIVFSARQGFDLGDKTTEIEIRRDNGSGAVMISTTLGMTVINDMASLTGSDTIIAGGSYTYSVWWKGQDSTTSMIYRSVQVLGVKR
jgi:fibronectin type 3 domain-containing protein